MHYGVFDYVRKIVPETSTSFVVPAPPPFPMSGSAIDLWFTESMYYDGGTVAVTDEISISRASIGYASTSTGTLVQFSADTLRITDLGLLMEPSRTNVVLWNRDLTNGAWTPTNITPLKDQTGPDGVANSASSLEATAGNGTILQSVTLASSARFQSAYVKRITGSGTVNMTMDNGATWTAITLTSSWTRVSIPTQTLANPTVGFRIVTSGDKIAVDFVQNEDGTDVSSPIPTTTTSAARAGEVLTCIGGSDTLLRSSTLSILLDSQVPVVPGTFRYLIGQPADSGQDWFLYLQDTLDNSVKSATDGAFIITATSGGPLFSTIAKCGYADDGTGRSLVMGGGAVVADSHKVTPTAAVGFSGGDSTALVRFTALFKRLTLWNSRLSDTVLQSLTV